MYCLGIHVFACSDNNLGYFQEGMHLRESGMEESLAPPPSRSVSASVSHSASHSVAPLATRAGSTPLQDAIIKALDIAPGLLLKAKTGGDL